MAYEKDNFIRINNSSGTVIPMYSFVRIEQFSDNTNTFAARKPNADNMGLSGIVVVLDQVLTGVGQSYGVGYLDGILVVEKTSGETIVVGDKVGTDTDEFTAIKIADDANGNNAGQFLVLAIYGSSDEYLVIRPRSMEQMY